MKLKKNTVKTVSWRIEVPEGLPERYRLIASVAKVSVDCLIAHILEEWIPMLYMVGSIKN